jgi:hypothetical protein
MREREDGVGLESLALKRGVRPLDTFHHARLYLRQRGPAGDE